MVISVVIAYELVRRYKLTVQQREVGRAVTQQAAQVPG